MDGTISPATTSQVSSETTSKSSTGRKASAWGSMIGNFENFKVFKITDTIIKQNFHLMFLQFRWQKEIWRKLSNA